MMKRRKQLSLVLAFCMVFSTLFAGIPVNAKWDEESGKAYGLVATEWLDTVWDDAGKEKLVTTEDGFPGTYVWNDEGNPVLDDDGNQKVEAIPYTDSWIGTSIRGFRYWFDYRETADAEPVHLMAKDLKVKYYDDQGPWNEEAKVEEKTGLLKDDPDQENWKGVVDFFPDKMGNYAFSYTKNGEEEQFMVRVSWPEIGFYSAQERSEDTLLLDEFSGNSAYYRVLKGEGTKKEIYLKLKDDDGQKVILAGDAGDKNGEERSSFELEPYGGPIMNSNESLDGYMEVENLGDGWYKLTFADEIIVPADPEDENSESWVTNGFNLRVNAVATDTQWDEDSEEWVEDENSEFYYIDARFNCQYCDPGLYAQVEGDGIYTEESGAVGFAVTPENLRMSLGKTTLSDDGTAKLDKLTSKELKGLKVEKAVDFDEYGNPSEWEEATAGEDYDCTPDGDYMVFESYYQHEYRISADGIGGCVYLYAYLPGLGFYSTNTRPADEEKIENRILEKTVDEAKSDTVYVLAWVNDEEDYGIKPTTMEIKAVADGKDVTDTYIKVDETLSNGYAIRITDAVAEDFKITVTAEMNNGERDYGELLVNVNSIKELVIVTPPTKIVYDEGDSFDAAGMVVNAAYKDGTKKAITDYEVSAKEALTASDETVTISYRGKSVTQAITVNPKNTPTPAPTATPPKKGAQLTSGNFVYKVTKAATAKTSGTLTVTALSKAGKKAGKLSVLATAKIDGYTYKVTKLGNNALKDAAAKSVTLGKNITAIPKGAFSGCKKLSTLTINATLKSVKKGAFKGCKKKIKVKGGNKKTRKSNIAKLKKSGYKKFK